MIAVKYLARRQRALWMACTSMCVPHTRTFGSGRNLQCYRARSYTYVHDIIWHGLIYRRCAWYNLCHKASLQSFNG